MAMPPNAPLKHGEQNLTYFQYLAILAAPILRDEDISLNFSGYIETINDYKKLGIMEWKKALELSKEINAWSEYMSEISNSIQKIYLDIDLRANETQALSSIKYDPDKVSNGNRLAYQDVSMLNEQKKRHILKALNDELSSKVRFLERAFYHCKSIGDNGHKSAFTIRENVIIQQDKKKYVQSSNSQGQGLED